MSLQYFSYIYCEIYCENVITFEVSRDLILYTACIARFCKANITTTFPYT